MNLKNRLAQFILLLTAALFCATGVGATLKVRIIHDATPQAEYATAKLSVALKQSGYGLQGTGPSYDYLISLALHPEKFEEEAFAIIPEGKVITVYGGDNRGLIYGTLSLVEALNNGVSLDNIKANQQRPALAFRGIKFNLPWQTYRPSTALDQHVPTVKDLEYWEAFLDMMVANRFNVISLWNMHPYTFMIKPKNFPEASPWSKKEMAEWQHFYHELFRMAKERALDTYIVHWNIFVSEAFSEAHNLKGRNYYPHYYVPGDSSEIVRRYLRESVTQVLAEYPNLDGIGVSHGEGMADMTPLERQQWMDDVLIAGMLEADRPVKLIHRVPFSSGRSSDPGASKSVEQVTRAAMEKLDQRFDGPIWVEMKFNWSHGHSTPTLEKVHGGQLGDTYFEPKPENYKITWQVRNEDFFALRWGVPNFIRQHIALNAQEAYVGGYFIGSETYIPALDYFTEPKYLEKNGYSTNWRWAFQRQWLFYKLWGRLLYQPETKDEVFQAEFTRRYGPEAKDLLQAFSLASQTQLRIASLYDATWDFTLYSEGFMALQGDTTRYISVDRLIKQGTMDKQYVSVAEYEQALSEGKGFEASRVTPPILVKQLEMDNKQALALVKTIVPKGDGAFMYEVADVQTWAYLGLHLAAKLEGAMALQRFRLGGDKKYQALAVKHLTQALEYWDKVIDITRPIYKNMKLTHNNHNAFGSNNNNLFHWALIRDQVADDVRIAKESVVY